MQKVKIPITIEPAKAATKRMTYDGYVVSNKFKRLLEVAEVVGENVDVAIECGVDQQDLVVIKGSVKTDLILTCQRCGNGVPYHAETQFTYTPVLDAAEESEEPIPEAYDEIEVDEFGAINLIQLVEDELMLALPIVAMHDPEDCEISDKDMTFGQLAPEATEEKKSNPFDVLKQLKN